MDSTLDTGTPGGPSSTEDVYVVIPAYNEAGVIAEVLKQLGPWFSNLVVVDDGSGDDTSKAALRSGARVVTHGVNLGQGAAIQTGIEYALGHGAQWIVTFDADGQHRPEDAAQMVARAKEQGLDALLGSRFLGNTVDMPPSKRLLLRLAVKFERLLTGYPLTDAHNGLRVLNRRACEAIDITLHGMAHASQMTKLLTSSGLAIAEHPVTIHYTDYSKAKGQSATNAINIVLDVLLKRLFP